MLKWCFTLPYLGSVYYVVEEKVKNNIVIIIYPSSDLRWVKKFLDSESFFLYIFYFA